MDRGVKFDLVDESLEGSERAAALARGEQSRAKSPYEICAPDVPGLNADLLFTLHAESVREYAIFLMDTRGVIRCWGEGARLMKWWTKQQAEGGHLRLLYPPGGAEDGTAEAHLQHAAEHGEYSGEGHRVRSDGSTFRAAVTLTALRDAQGRLAGFTKVTRDFSARRAVEASLRQQAALAPTPAGTDEASRLKSQFVANVSHELRTPLNAMVGFVELLARDPNLTEQQRGMITRIKRNGQHLTDLIRDLLEVARAEAGRLPITASGRRLGPAVQEALADIEGEAFNQGIVLTNSVSGAAADVPYWGDEARVRQIVLNLLANAIKFTPRGGHIKVSGGTGEGVKGAALEGPGPWMYVRVEDTGRGIPPDRLDSIFEAFEQTDAADLHRGTGLGLSISRRLARLMGGDIVVSSELGVGSTFTLWLPIAPSDPVPR